MNTRSTRLILSVLALGSLSGCHSIFSSNHSIAETAVEDVDLSGYFAQRLAEGRVHLQSNRPGAAVAAFRQASYEPALRARAYNGMAIAYDQLGRTDLAQRYFIAAIEIEPENVSFASNLVHFSETRGVDAATMMDVTLAQATAMLEEDAPLPVVSEGPVAEPTTGQGAMHRVSDREVHIAAQEEAPFQQALEPAGTERPAVVHVERRARTSRRNPLFVAARGQTSQDRTNAVVDEPQVRAPARARTRAADTRGRVSYPIRIPLRES